MRSRTHRKGTRRATVAVISATVAALAVGFIGVLSASAGEEPPNEKVTLCHSTSSQTNPYNLIEVDENAIANVILGQNGHATHTGGIFPEPGWGDIIPAFNIPPNSFGGLNNTAEGLAILENGCVPPGFVPPTQPPPTQPPETAPPRTAPPGPAAAPPAPAAPSAAAPVAGQPRTTG